MSEYINTINVLTDGRLSLREGLHDHAVSLRYGRSGEGIAFEKSLAARAVGKNRGEVAELVIAPPGNPSDLRLPEIFVSREMSLGVFW